MTYEKWRRLKETERLVLADYSQLVPALRQYEGDRVEVTYPDGDKARFWVGRSTGWRPIHLEINTTRSDGGCQVYFPEGTTVRLVRRRNVA
jgi:hypothetical protein